jgi:hypothetical protein
VSRSRPIGIATDLLFLYSAPREYRVCPCGVRSLGVCLVSATQVLDHVPSSPAESSCISPPQLPSWTRPGTPLTHRPAAADARTPPAGHAPDTVPPWKSDLHGHLSHPRQRFPGEPGTGTAGPGRAGPPRSAGRPDSREEGSGARTPRATGAPHYVLGHPGSDLLARLVAAVDLRATPRGTCHRPPVDRLRHQAQASPNDHVGASDSAELSTLLGCKLTRPIGCVPFGVIGVLTIPTLVNATTRSPASSAPDLKETQYIFMG